MKSLYVTLGVGKKASAQEIKRAYYALAHRYHPDKGTQAPEDIERFRQASFAYAVLSDPRQRSLYNRFGPLALRALSASNSNNMAQVPPLAVLLNDLAKQLAHVLRQATPQPPAPPKGEDQHLSLQLSVAVLLAGGGRTLRLQRERSCVPCAGSGTQSPQGAQSCPLCRSQGALSLGFGPMRVSRRCPACQGRGKLILLPCPKCRGKGHQAPFVDTRVRIPAMTPVDAVLRLRHLGGPGVGHGPRGDLLLTLQALPWGPLDVEGFDLCCTLPLSAAEATLGATVAVPLPGGDVLAQIPAGSQHGQEVWVPQGGLPQRSGGRGFLRLRLAIEIAQTAPSATAMAAWRQVAQAQPSDSASDYPQRAALWQQLRTSGEEPA